MKNKNVKFVAGLLSCVMLFSTFSTISFASDIPDNQSEKNLADDIPYTNAVDYPAEEIIPVDKSTSDDLNEILETAIIDSLTIPDSAFVTVFDSKETIMDSIVSEEEFKINGFITENRTQYNLHEFYDFQSTSRFHIADWAYEANLITEAEKIDVFCDLIISQNFENIDCLESVVDTIQQYRSNSFVSEQLNSKISAILTRPSSIGLGNSSSTRDGESTYISSNFEVYYDSNDISSTSARLVAEYFERVKTMYLNLGFREPILEAGKTRYCATHQRHCCRTRSWPDLQRHCFWDERFWSVCKNYERI